MLRTLRWALLGAGWLAAIPALAADAYSIKAVTAPVPKELRAPIAQLLSENAVQFLDAKGSPIAHIWFRKEIPAKATPAQIQNGLTYREVEETTILGAVRFDQ